MCEIHKYMLVRMQTAWNKYLDSILSIFHTELNKMLLLEKKIIFFPSTTSQIYPELVPVKSLERILNQTLHKLNCTYRLLS